MWVGFRAVLAVGSVNLDLSKMMKRPNHSNGRLEGYVSTPIIRQRWPEFGFELRRWAPAICPR